MKKTSWKFVMVMTYVFLFCLPGVYSFAATKWVTIPNPDFIIDSYRGVDAVYTNEKNADADEKYSCAAYVKKYYKQIYNIGVFNLIDEGPPVVRDVVGVSFKKVTDPKEGDLVFWPVSKNGNNHSAIIKKVEGSTITLIEQNYKTGIVAALNRTITYPSDKFQIFRITGNVEEKIPADSNFTPSIGTEAPIHITMDEYTISVICEKFRFGIINGVEGDQYNHKQILDDTLDAQSYELNSDTPFSFTLDPSKMAGWYLDGDTWKTIKKEEVTAQRAYFTIYNRSEVDTGLPGLSDETIPAFREDDVYLPMPELPSVEANSIFTDISTSHWAYESIKRCAEMGLLTGFEDGSFQPDKALSRAEFTVLLAKTSGAQITQYVNTGFADVSNESWYSGFVAYGKEFLPGKNGYYYPTEGATRQDVCAAILKVLQFSNLNVDTSVLSQFSDGNLIQQENRNAVAFALGIDLMKGFEDGSFRPNDALTRAQAAVIFAKL